MKDLDLIKEALLSLIVILVMIIITSSIYTMSKNSQIIVDSINEDNKGINEMILGGYDSDKKEYDLDEELKKVQNLLEKTY